MSLNTKIQILGVIALALSPVLGMLNCSCSKNNQEYSNAVDKAVEAKSPSCCDKEEVETTCCDANAVDTDNPCNVSPDCYCKSAYCLCGINPALPQAISRQGQRLTYSAYTAPVCTLNTDSGVDPGNSSYNLYYPVPSNKTSTHLMHCAFRC